MSGTINTTAGPVVGPAHPGRTAQGVSMATTKKASNRAGGMKATTKSRPKAATAARKPTTKQRAAKRGG